MAFAAESRAITIGEITEGPAPREIAYKAVPDSSLMMFMFTPEDFSPADSRTAIVWIHGGAWTGGYAEQYFPQCRYYASRGAVTFSIRHRLVWSGAESVFDCLEDCKSAVRYIREHAAEFGINPRRLVVMGDSAGGHLAACLSVFDRDYDNTDEDLTVSSRPNAVVMYNPVSDMAIPMWLPLFRPGTGPYGDRTPEEQARAISPTFHVNGDRPPSLIVHGFADRIVSPQQSIELATELTKAGNHCDLLMLGETDHSFVIVGWATTPLATVVRANRAGDEFLISLGYLDGEPTLAE